MFTNLKMQNANTVDLKLLIVVSFKLVVLQLRNDVSLGYKVINVTTNSISDRRTCPSKQKRFYATVQPKRRTEKTLDATHNKQNYPSDHTGRSKKRIFTPVRKIGRNNNIPQKRQCSKASKRAKHNHTLFETLHSMIIIRNLQMQLLHHHNVNEKFLIFCHSLYHLLSILTSHASFFVNIHHFSNLTFRIIVHLPHFTSTFAQNPFIVCFAAQEFPNSHAQRISKNIRKAEN
mmetsp:Transcript_14568/g.21493  ORF Transcript_14568/g.21493 Transcript_14568/m.21493 type:complete len:232 (+) Transcript_14568:405-1100(+)